MNKLCIVAMAALASSQLWAVHGTIRTTADTKEGEIKWVGRAKKYVITTKTKGGTSVDMEFPLADVVSLDIAKPAGYDKAVEAVQRGQGAAAINPLTKIVNEYKMLEWDRPAGRYLAEAYLSAGDPQKAYDMAQSIISDDKTAAYKGDLAPAYWQALLKLGKTTQLNNCLSKAATSGDRASSAAAVVMRGDMILAEGGDSEEAYRQALRDGYLRVALMYADEECREARAAALAKAAKCFDKLSMAGRAEAFRAEARKL